MDLIERFRYIMKLNNMTASAFADEIGVQRSSVSHILSGRNKPSLEFIQKVIKRFPKVDSGWLISGSTSMVESKEKPVALTNQINDGPTVPYSKREAVQSKVESTHQTNQKSIAKVLVFYTDGTFEEFNSLK